MTDTDEKYDYIRPSHYQSAGIETIEKMVRIWGKETIATWCDLTAFKYRERIGNKPSEPVERDMEKIRWYENKAKELRSQLASEMITHQPIGVPNSESSADLGQHTMD